MSSRMLIRAAVRSNAEWCHAFSGTHGIEGRFDEALWSSPVRTPTYYPDAVTLRPEITVEQVLSCIDSGEGCSVKDSFACLDLADDRVQTAVPGRVGGQAAVQDSSRGSSTMVDGGHRGSPS